LKTKTSDVSWVMEIRPHNGWFNIDLAELWRYRDLIFLFVRRDFVTVYKQTILGPIWFLLNPLFTSIVYSLIFANIAKIQTDGIPPILFYMSGTIAWTYFAGCMIKTSNTFIENAGIFGKVYFPRLVVPISVVISNILTFLIQLAMFLVFLLYFIIIGTPVFPTIWVLFIPLLLVQMATLGLGMGILISSMTTKYRDLAMALGFGAQLWMYATPVVYPISQIPVKWQWLFAFNPMTAIVETFRYAFLGSGAIQPWMVVMSAGVTLLILIIGIMFFCRIEKTFMDTV